MQLYKDRFCLIIFDPLTYTIEFTWLSQPGMAYFLECFKRCVSLSEKYKAKYVLADNTIGVQMDMATQRSIIDHGVGVQNLEIDKYARIVPLDIFQEMVSYKIADETFGIYSKNTRFKVFSNKLLARMWLHTPSEEQKPDSERNTDTLV